MPAVLQNVWLKIKKYKLPLLGAVLLLTLCLILAGNAHRRDHYQVQAVWQEENATLSVQETIRLTNRAGESLDHLCLRLYPNAFAEERSVPVPDNELSIAYPEGFASGGVSNLSVQVNGKNAPFVLEGAQRTVLRVQLPFSLRPQGGAEVTLRYDAALSRNRLRTGVLTKDVRLCNVLATLCIFQDGAFRTDDYTPIGDPFLSECADWDVELTAPGGYVAAGPGLVRAEDGRWTFRTRNQRDFALLLSKDYEVAQAEQNGICIRSFAFTEEDAQQALDTAAQALGLYSEWFGDYPYPDFTVCAADFYVGGMPPWAATRSLPPGRMKRWRNIPRCCITNRFTVQILLILSIKTWCAPPWTIRRCAAWALRRSSPALKAQRSTTRWSTARARPCCTTCARTWATKPF